ncbi:glycoprotein-N-acetylgalactosamine 3-beta-galactosyltransferase 1-like [Sitodiplosis mosellana]|uniref:glycoprotein-N-acetylgalactosamine 3-beta-galactosyltransferase 1-like n=1 Tax=Sitodiplosis mosellana TaxID=263140 RepID=UPI0024451D19|nr:glycoprotein-N-acetylgalactosamine 3-beta-galactosyltransferase 1-like [Sitodiplosis mosellana]
MNSKITFFWFLIGFGIGFFIDLNKSNEFEVDLRKAPPSDLTQTSVVEDVKKIRILCFLSTMSKSYSTRAVHIMQTWGKHCDKLLFFGSYVTDGNIGAIGFNVTEGHDYIWGKVKLIMQHIHKNFLNDYDWFFKGDDDTFLIPENLRYMLSAYSTDDPIYFGYKKNSSMHKRGFFSGGAGYVLSRQTVRTFVEKVLTNKEFYRKSEGEPGCNLKTDARNEDEDISVCLDYYNVYPGDSRDLLNRGRFFPYKPEAHLFGKPDPKNGHWTTKYYWSDEGLDCCSNYTISFHYILTKYQYTMYFLAYRLQPFGFRRHFPSLPMKVNFSQVVKMLEQEGANASLRGF